MKIVVVGSSNIDMVARVSHLPLPGETVGNAHFLQAYGGKGANQAVAAARLGGDVTFVTALGNDRYAALLKDYYAKEGIVTSQIVIDKQNPTGVALILVDDNAENCIAVAPGANASLLVECLKDIDIILNQADILLLQAEIPYETIKQVALIAHEKGVKVILNPAPACMVDFDLMQVVDILVVNENEAEYISCSSLQDETVEQIADKLYGMGAKSVVITLGSKGAYVKTYIESYIVSSFSVKAVDTTAAGDVFCGALAVACAQEPLNSKAVRFASAASAIAVTRAGAQPSIPTLREVEEFLKKR